MYQIPEEERTQQFDVPKELEGLPELKPEDQQYFGKLLKEVSMLLCWEHRRPPSAGAGLCSHRPML